MYKIKLNEHVSTIPTIGFNVETVEPKNGLSFTVWDVGGQEKIRRLWEHYYANSDGLIFVVDSNDPARMEEAREELMGIIKDDRMRHVPVVVFANKQDMPHALKPGEVVEKLGLRQLTDRKWHLQGTCAAHGEGLYEGLEELSVLVKDFKRNYRS